MYLPTQKNLSLLKNQNLSPDLIWLSDRLDLFGTYGVLI